MTRLIIKEALKKYSKIEIALLLAHVLNKPKEFLYLNPGHKLSVNQLISLSVLVKRRQKGEPVAHILGYKGFYGLRFKVNRNVLIPRPETEWVVERIRNYELGIMNGEQLRVLDVGTGSGCIAISLEFFLGPKARITACDISKKAIAVAKQNSKNILSGRRFDTSTYRSASIKFVQSDLLKNIRGNFDIIVANLPYGWQEWNNNTTVEAMGLKFEPKQALFTKEGGLYEIRRLLMQVAARKHKPSLVYLEFDPRQKVKLNILIKKYLPKAKVKFHKDFSSLWRYAEIKN